MNDAMNGIIPQQEVPHRHVWEKVAWGAAAAVLLAALLGAALHVQRVERDNRALMDQHALVTLAFVAGNAARELQEERGTAVAYLLGRKLHLLREYRAQSEQADAKVNALQHYVGSLPYGSIPSAVGGTLEAARRGLAMLETKRRMVQDLDWQLQQMDAFYGPLTQHLLDTVHQARAALRDPAAAAVAEAYGNALQAHELAGRELVLVALWESGAALDLRQLEMLAERQNLYSGALLATGAGQRPGFAFELEAREADVAGVREAVGQVIANGRPSVATAQAWRYAAQTRAQLISNVGQQFAAELRGRADGLARQAALARDRSRLLLGSVLATGLLGFGLRARRSLRRRAAQMHAAPASPAIAGCAPPRAPMVLNPAPHQA